ncbi:hypothetical protein QNH14_05175 [Apirhabdus apintestini]|uniref:hypothetical protein n=1 Tax=Erwinia sp. HR93 TaxID=3094840 RepID=UPI002ADEB5CD|nr:hypothetical protein [Erwinia sp. HR93]MEA1065630.1 hypothetical protein [Erwinia sp. HR93]WPM85483.1 hypothetical protein QNH14_05175 [Enterobacteriaceae bacterium CA-0114]
MGTLTRCVVTRADSTAQEMRLVIVTADAVAMASHSRTHIDLKETEILSALS